MKLDALEQIAGYAMISAAFLTNGKESMLIALDENGMPLNETLLDEAKGKAMYFAGCFGIVNGVAAAKPQCAEDMPTMLMAMPAFLEYVRQRLAPQAKEVSWLERLYQLPDTRDEFGPA